MLTVSELQENLEEMFPQYYMHGDMLDIHSLCVTRSGRVNMHVMLHTMLIIMSLIILLIKAMKNFNCLKISRKTVYENMVNKNSNVDIIGFHYIVSI